MHVPETLEGITSTWLSQALEGHHQFAGADFTEPQIERIGEGFGLAGLTARVSLKAAPTGSLVVKLCGTTSGLREGSFYRTFAPRMPVRLPDCYAVVEDTESSTCALLLEDLTEAVQGDCIVGATPAQARAAVGAAARFHGAFEASEADDFLALPLWEYDAAKVEARVAQCREQFLKLFGAELESGTEARIDELPERLRAGALALSAATPTLLHTDLHFDNVLFVADEPVILDWVDVRRGPGVMDLVRLFVEGMTASTRRAHQAELLEHYTTTLVHVGAEPPTAEEFREHLAAACARCFASAVIWGGREDAGLDRPRVRDIVRSLARNTASAACDDWLRAP